MNPFLNKIKSLRTSGYFLIGANIFPAIGVLFLGWKIEDVLLIYFLETSVIGFYNILKLLTLKMKDYEDYKIFGIIIKVFFSIIFTVHFGAMTFLFGSMIYLVSSVFTLTRPDIIKTLTSDWPAILLLVISHGYSFRNNYYLGGERERSSIRILMIHPYIRLMGLLGILFVGGMLGTLITLKFGQPVFFILIFIIIKTAVDLIGHLRERKKFRNKN